MSANLIDEGRLALMPGDLRLPTIKQVWSEFATRSDKEGWPAARFLSALAEHELAERRVRRIARHLEEARLPPGKTLDDLAYVTKDQAETSVLFELISARYEQRSLLITANQPFGEWGKIFPDQAMTLAAIDRLVHHAIIFEMNVESYRRKAAIERKRGAGRPPTRATSKTSA